MEKVQAMRTAKLAAILAGILLSACTANMARQPEPSNQPVPPKVENKTPFPNLTLTGVDKFGEYTSLALKITYAIADDGSLRAQTVGQEPILDEHTAQEDRYRCMPYGAGYNQLTTWFPDTGIFVSGAALAILKNQNGQPRPLEPMVAGDNGIMAVTGPHARELEYVYVPCVGERRVDKGVRTVEYVQPGDRLTLNPSGQDKQPVTLILPRYPRPFVWLEFSGRSARAIAPANLVLLTVDWPKRRVVAQYQLTVAMLPQVSDARWMALLPSQALAKDPVLQRINDDIERYIETCPTPTKPMDTCTNPHGQLPESVRP